MNQQNNNPLLEVVSIPEAAQLWGVCVKSVRRAMDSKKNALETRKSGRMVLISVQSLKRRWGDPITPLE